MDHSIKLREAADAMRERESRRRAEMAWFAAAPKTWSPVMTEQEQAAHEAYVREHKLPF